jgi:hypothetical protein
MAVDECIGDYALIEHWRMSLVRLGDYTARWISLRRQLAKTCPTVSKLAIRDEWPVGVNRGMRVGSERNEALREFFLETRCDG